MLFKKNDKFGIIQYLSDVKNVHKRIKELEKGKEEPNKENVLEVINNIKKLHTEGKEILTLIENDTEIKDKKKDFMTKVVADKFNDLKPIYEKSLAFEKKINEYYNI